MGTCRIGGALGHGTSVSLWGAAGLGMSLGGPCVMGPGTPHVFPHIQQHTRTSHVATPSPHVLPPVLVTPHIVPPRPSDANPVLYLPPQCHATSLVTSPYAWGMLGAAPVLWLRTINKMHVSCALSLCLDSWRMVGWGHLGPQRDGGMGACVLLAQANAWTLGSLGREGLQTPASLWGGGDRGRPRSLSKHPICIQPFSQMPWEHPMPHTDTWVHPTPCISTSCPPSPSREHPWSTKRLTHPLY